MLQERALREARHKELAVTAVLSGRERLDDARDRLASVTTDYDVALATLANVLGSAEAAAAFLQEILGEAAESATVISKALRVADGAMVKEAERVLAEQALTEPSRAGRGRRPRRTSQPSQAVPDPAGVQSPGSGEAGADAGPKRPEGAGNSDPPQAGGGAWG
ncbi:hypothetical protein [Sphaerisporangium album]|nr:hypothetical protein [Sphaerisporangium album]